MVQLRDSDAEWLVKRVVTPVQWVLRVLLIAGAIVLSVCLFFVPIAGVLLAAGVIYLTYRLFRAFNVEYEYIATNGAIDIDRITARSKRKRLHSFDAKAIELLARVNDPDHKGEFDSVSYRTKLDFSSGAVSDRTLFCVYNDKEGGRTRLVWEPNDKIIEQFRQLVPSKVKL